MPVVVLFCAAQVECGFPLNVVNDSARPSLKLLAGEDQPLLVRRNAFLDLDLDRGGVNGFTYIIAHSESTRRSVDSFWMP